MDENKILTQLLGIKQLEVTGSTFEGSEEIHLRGVGWCIVHDDFGASAVKNLCRAGRMEMLAASPELIACYTLKEDFRALLFMGCLRMQKGLMGRSSYIEQGLSFLQSHSLEFPMVL